VALPLLPGPLPGLLPDTGPPLPGPVPPAPIGATVIGSGSQVFATPVTGSPLPGTASLAIKCANTPGDWMVAVITWRCPPGYDAPVFTVADDAHNWWEPCDAGSSMSSDQGLVRCSVWRAPAARVTAPPKDSGLPPQTTVFVAPNSYTTAFAAIIWNVANMAPWVNTMAATGFGNSVTAITGSLPAPVSQQFAVTVAASDNLTDTVTLAPGGLWSPVATVTGSNGVDDSADIQCSAAWQYTTTACSATWNSTGTVNFAVGLGGMLCAAAAPARPLSNWPVTYFEMAPGSGFQTMPDNMTWVPVTTASMALEITQGRQYETAQLSTGEGTLLFDNPTGSFLPPGSGSLAGINAGTPVRLRTAWTGGSWQVSFTGNGFTANPQAQGSVTIPATAGATYSFPAWLACSVPWAAGVSLVITFQNGSGTPLGTAASAPVTSPLATLAIVTGIAPSGTVQAVITVQANGIPPVNAAFRAASAPYPSVPGWLLLPPAVPWTAANGATVTVTGQWKPDPLGPPWATPWYLPYSGNIERLPQQWDETYRGFTEATVTDAWFAMNCEPQPIMSTEVLHDNPSHYWPCADAQGASAAANLAQGSNVPLTVTQSKYGAGGIQQQFGSTPATTLVGTSSTLLINPTFRVTVGEGMWQLTNVGALSANSGYTLVASTSTFPPIAGGVSIEFWFQMQSPFSLQQPSLMTVGNTAGQIFGFYADTLSAGLHMSWHNGASLTTIGSTVYTLTPGTPPMTQVVITFNRTAWTVYLNGQQAGSGSWGSPHLPQDFSFIWLNGTSNAAGISSLNFNGSTGQLAVFPFLLPQQRILTHYKAALTGLAGEPSQNRIERLLQGGDNAPGRRAIGKQGGIYVTPVVSCQDIPGEPTSQSVSNIAQAVLPGMFYVAPTGDLVSLSRQAAWNQAVQWVLGEESFAGEFHYEPDISFDYDLTRIQNEIQLTQLDTQDDVVPADTALVDASQKQYGCVTNFATGYLNGDTRVALNYGPGLLDLANWLANTYAAPDLRLNHVTVTAQASPFRWRFVLGVSVGDLVTVNRRPFGAGNPVISITGRVTQTQRRWAFGVKGEVSASVTCIIDNAPEAAALQLGSTTLGLLNGLNTLAW